MSRSQSNQSFCKFHVIYDDHKHRYNSRKCLPCTVVMYIQINIRRTYIFKYFIAHHVLLKHLHTTKWNSISGVCQENLELSQGSLWISRECIFNDFSRSMGALAHLLKVSLGSGVLAMPLAFKNAGYVVGTFGTILIGLICGHVIHILVSQQINIGIFHIMKTVT